MRTIVTAILVARTGGAWLEQTLAALAEQTRRPDRVVAVAAGGGERLTQQLSTGTQLVIGASGPLPFGAAVERAVAALPADTEAVQEWLWLLSEDSAPEPRALELILQTVQRAPSVAVAGPKLVDWDHPERIIELGQSLTKRGDRWLLRRQELDQQQYDHLQDVLGVGPVGMLVRRDVWAQLDGFDPAFPVFDDGLDFSVRARLAGYRVVVAPASRVRFARSGVAGPRIDRSRAVLRTAHRQGRTAHLRRRIAYAPAFLSFFMWLGLPLVAIARVFWALIREQPGRMIGEFASALQVFFTPGAIIGTRRRLARANSVGWAAVRPLRIDPKTVRTTKMIDREAILVAQGRHARELHFVSTGGLAVLITATVVSLVLTWWALAETSLVGGGLAPLSPIGELWGNTLTQGGVPADPFAWVLAVLGSLTFWNPSHAVVLLFIAAIPLAALGGWIWGAQLTGSTAGRALVGLGWALSPVLIGSLDAGRLPTVILAVTLPWLLLAASRSRESWSWAGTASLLAAVALACAPVLIPAALVLWVVGLASSVRGITRVLSIAIAPLVLFAPKLVSLIGGSPLDLLLDPGITAAHRPSTVWHLMLGFPEFGLAGWEGLLDGIGLGGPPVTLLVGVLLLPVVLLAVLGLFTGRVLVTVLLALLGGLGLATAIASTQLRLLSEGSESVALWAGSGLAVYWVGVLGLAAVGSTVLGRAAAPLVSVALVLMMVAVAPLASQLLLAQTGLRSGETQMPAIVQAAGAADPQMRTLVITAQGRGIVRTELITGTGLRLDQLRTADLSSEATEQDAWVADAVGLLASTGRDDELQQLLGEHGVGFVLLRDSAGSSAAGSSALGSTAAGAGTAADAQRARLQASLDQHAALSSAGQTDHGLLWRLQNTGDVSAEAAAQAEGLANAETSADRALDGTTLSGHTIWWVQVIVLLAMLLLALPTGEVVERPERRRRGGKLRPAGAGAGAGPGVAAGTPEISALTATTVVDEVPGAAAETAAAETAAAETETAQPTTTAAEPSEAPAQPAPDPELEAESTVAAESTNSTSSTDATGGTDSSGTTDATGPSEPAEGGER